jgi:Cytochrome C oxidase, cbb3-type, subunit III
VIPRVEGRGSRIEDRTSRIAKLFPSSILHPPSSILHPLSSILGLSSSIFILALALAACRQQMANQPYQQPLEASEFFSDGMASRPAVRGTVPHGTDQDSQLPRSDQVAGKGQDGFPFALTIAVIARGQERYNVYCAPCHDRTGYGEGMVVQRGFTKARSFHLPELRDAPAGHFVDVMTNGFGAMPSYAHAVAPRDRWAIAAYIRALQLSRHAPVAELAAEDRAKLQEAR